MLRNNSKMTLISNGPRRPGQFEWHNENCLIEYYGISKLDPENIGDMPLRTIWCATHGHWAHETPVRVIWEFEDGTRVTRKI
jgi:hypothetical protein